MKFYLPAFSFLLFLLVSINTNAQTITNVGISNSNICPGSLVNVNFTVTNGNGNPRHFTSSTIYTLFLSNATGTGFTSVYSASSTTVPSGNGGSAIITFSNLPSPTTLPPGTGYKISISSDAPLIPVNSGTNVSDPFTIFENPIVTYSKIFASTCNGGTDGSISVTATGGISPYTYSWTGVNGFTATTANISNLALGDYNVVVKDQNLCSDSVQGITIKMTGPLGVGASITKPTCAGNDGALNVYRIGGIYDGVTPIQYRLDGPVTIAYQNSGTFSGLPSGNYIVTVKDSKGCTFAQQFTIATDTRPAPSVGILSKIKPNCSGSEGSIAAFRINGVYENNIPIQYQLTGAATVPYQNSNVFTNLIAGDYYVYVKDSRGCVGILAVTLENDSRPAPSLGYQATGPGCSGNDGSINAYRIGGVYDGTNPIEFKLDGDATIPYQSSGVFNDLPAGDYTVTVKDSRGCTGSSLITLTQAEPLTFTPNRYIRNVSACGGGTDGKIVTAVSGGVTPYHYFLNGVEVGVSSLKAFGFDNLQANVLYQISVTDSKGCTISEGITLNQASTPTAIIAYKGNTTCITGTDGFITVGYNAGGVPGYTYSNDGGATFQSSYRFLNLSSGTYNVVVKDSKGCSSAPVAAVIGQGTATCFTGGSQENSVQNRLGNSTSIVPDLKGVSNTVVKIKAYPNPFASEFTLDVKGKYSDKISVILTDVLGRTLYQVKGNANQQYKLGKNLQKGIYFVQIRNGGSIQTIKIVKD